MTDPTKPPPPPLHIDVPGYTGPERRTEFRLWREQVDRRFEDGAKTMKELRKELEANTAATQSVCDNTAELVSLLNSFKGAFKVFDLVGKAARPLGYIAVAASSIWGFVSVIKGGGSPK